MLGVVNKRKSPYRHNKHLSLMFLSIFMMSTFVALATTFQVFAADSKDFRILVNELANPPVTNGVTAENQAASADYFTAVVGCFQWGLADENGAIYSDSSEPSDPASFFTKGDNNKVYISAKAGEAKCSDALTAGISLWGWGTSYGSFLRDAGWSYEDGIFIAPGNTSSTKAGKEARGNAIRIAILKKAYGGQENYDPDSQLSDAAKYLRLKNAFYNNCATNMKLDQTIEENQSKAKNEVFKNSQDDKTLVYGILYDAGFKGVNPYASTYKTSISITDDNGYEAVVTNNKFSGEKFYQWVDDNQPPVHMAFTEGTFNVYGHYGTYDAQIGSDITCSSLAIRFRNKDNPLLTAYAIYTQTNPTLYKDQDNRPGGDGIVEDGSIDEPTCGSSVSGIGWIVCPIIESLTKLNDGVWKILQKILFINPISQSGDLYKVWSIIRSIANIALVIAFLLIIFSQITSVGIDNYGVKKLLPKLIIAAILINLSFFIVQISVDVANILGDSVYKVITNIVPAINKDWSDLLSAIGKAATPTAIAGAVGVVTIGSIGGPLAAFLLLLPAAIVGILSLLAALFTLVFRQAAIPILAILAPLAFVAYMLPNTESLFKKWKDLLVKMLVLYPLAALIFAGAQLAASLIISQQEDDWWNILIGLIVLTLPLFSLPFIASKGGAIMSAVGGALQKMAKSAKAPLTNAVKPYAERAAASNRAGERGPFGFRRSQDEMDERLRNNKRGLSQRMNDAKMLVKKDTEGSQARAENNFNDRAIHSNDKAPTNPDGSAMSDRQRAGFERRQQSAKRALQSIDASQAQGQRKEEVGEALKSRLEGFKSTPGSYENRTEMARRQYNLDKTNSETQTEKAWKDYSTNAASDDNIKEKEKADAKLTIADNENIERLTEQSKQAEQEAILAESTGKDSAGEVLSQEDIKKKRESATQLASEIESTKKNIAKRQTEINTLKTINANAKASGVNMADVSRKTMDERADKNAIVNADNLNTENYAKEIQQNEEFRIRTAGIDTVYGEARSQAGAQSMIEETRNKNVASQKTLFKNQNYGRDNLTRVIGKDENGNTVPMMTKDGQKPTNEQIEAAFSMIMENGEFNAIKSAIDSIDENKYDSQLQQSLAKIIASSPNKPKYFGGTNIDQLSTGTWPKDTSVDSLMVDTVFKKKISANAFASMDSDEMSQWAALFKDPKFGEKLVDKFKAKPETDANNNPISPEDSANNAMGMFRGALDKALADDRLNVNFGGNKEIPLKKILENTSKYSTTQQPTAPVPTPTDDMFDGGV